MFLASWRVVLGVQRIAVLVLIMLVLRGLQVSCCGKHQRIHSEAARAGCGRDLCSWGCSTTPPQVLGEQRLVLLLVGLALDPDWCSNASVAYVSVGDCC